MIGGLVNIIEVLVFPGILFVMSYSLYCNWINRKIAARLQNRVDCWLRRILPQQLQIKHFSTLHL